MLIWSELRMEWSEEGNVMNEQLTPLHQLQHSWGISWIEVMRIPELFDYHRRCLHESTSVPIPTLDQKTQTRRGEKTRKKLSDWNAGDSLYGRSVICFIKTGFERTAIGNLVHFFVWATETWSSPARALSKCVEWERIELSGCFTFSWSFFALVNRSVNTQRWLNLGVGRERKVSGSVAQKA